jgi:zinc/manganese transport system substrate-binding protein
VRAATITATVGLMVLAVGLVGCGRDSGHGPGSVVASTDVWGSVAQAVAGQHLPVKSLVTSAAADPHSFEVSPADAAALIDAKLVVYNGGGYDHWVDDVLAGHPDVPSVDAYSLLDAAALGEPKPANEHVFYNIGTAKAVAATIADRLSSTDPANAADYRANAEAFARSADAIAATEHGIGAAHPSASVVATEPVAHYLLVAAGVTDRTPAGFAAAVEDGHDPSPADMAAMLDLINKRQVAALLFNPQTATAATTQLQTAAQRAGIPIVAVTETLPAGTDYLSWQRQTADALAAALQPSR